MIRSEFWKGSTRQQRTDIRGEPLVRSGQHLIRGAGAQPGRTIVRVIVHVRNDERIVGQIVVGYIGGQLGERQQHCSPGLHCSARRRNKQTERDAEGKRRYRRLSSPPTASDSA